MIFIGNTGSGKSTTINYLAGIELIAQEVENTDDDEFTINLKN